MRKGEISTGTGGSHAVRVRVSVVAARAAATVSRLFITRHIDISDSKEGNVAYLKTLREVSSYIALDTRRA